MNFYQKREGKNYVKNENEFEIIKINNWKCMTFTEVINQMKQKWENVNIYKNF